MTKFHKISLEQYIKDRVGDLMQAGLSQQEAADAAKEEYDNIVMPRRSTTFSAGYDLRSPGEYVLAPGESLSIPTGLRIQMEEDMWLGVYIRSSLGFKYNVRLKNSVGVIDADYFNADNEGHLKVGIYNGGDKTLQIHAGDAIAQGILQKYYVTDDDEPVQQRRSGGFGSTNQ